MKRATVPSILVAVVLLALAVTAEAQQPGKIPQIGFLSSGPATRPCACVVPASSSVNSALAGHMART